MSGTCSTRGAAAPQIAHAATSHRAQRRNRSSSRAALPLHFTKIDLVTYRNIESLKVFAQPDDGLAPEDFSDDSLESMFGAVELEPEEGDPDGTPDALPERE